MRQVTLGVPRNNHPIRTAAALGSEDVALLRGPGALSVNGLTRASGFETVNVTE